MRLAFVGRSSSRNGVTCSATACCSVRWLCRPSIFAAIPTGLVAFIQARDLNPDQISQIQRYISQLPEGVTPSSPPRRSSSSNFMAYFLLIPAMVPMAIATQSVIGEKVARSLEPQLATPLQVPELLAGKTIAAALPAVTATWLVYVATA